MSGVPRPPRIPADLAGRVFRGRSAVDRGLLTPDDLRSSAWRRLFNGVYVDAGVPVTHRLLCLVAQAHVLPSGSVIAGRSAAHLYGVPADPDDPVEVIVPPGHRPRSTDRLRPHTGSPPAAEIRTVGRLRVTTPPRTCWDLVRWRGLVDGVVLTDRLLDAGALFAGELDKYAAEHRESRWGARFEQAVRLTDGGAESPPESELRVRLVLAGLPPPVVQHNVFAGGRFVARVDLAWPAQRVAVEYDGAWHGAPAQLHADRRRLNRLVAAGWTVLHVTSVRLRGDLDGVVAEVRAAIGRCL
jgi:hypothetical protein